MSIGIDDYRKMLIPPLTEEGFASFLEALSQKPVKGFSYDPRRIQPTSLVEDIPDISPDYEMSGYAIYPYGTFLSSNPLYLSGAIYPMDRAAYRVSWLLSKCLKEIERPWICDLCAAPGGKTIALAHLIEPGLILANDIDRRRAGILSTNLERAGTNNSIVTCLDPIRLLPAASKTFDAVILDAPCSGSGMSRKNESVEEDWSEQKVQRCSSIQRNLIEVASQLVREGGFLCYSTCSYSRKENEEIVGSLLEKHSDFEQIKVDALRSIEGIDSLGLRFIPGIHLGEGQYVCILKRTGNSIRARTCLQHTIELSMKPFPAVRYRDIDWIISECPEWVASLSPLKIGYRVQSNPKNSLCQYDWSLSKLEDAPFKRLELSRDETISYFRGQDLRSSRLLEGTRGLVILTYKGFSLGFGDRQVRRIRNLLPKGLRVKG